MSTQRYTVTVPYREIIEGEASFVVFADSPEQAIKDVKKLRWDDVTYLGGDTEIEYDFDKHEVDYIYTEGED